MAAILTAKEQLLRRIQELVLLLRARDRVEPPHAYDPLDRLTRPVVRVRVRPQHAAQVCLQPMLLGRFQLVASLVYAVALDCARNLYLHAHVDAGEGIVAATLISQDVGLMYVLCAHQYRPEMTLFCLSWGW